MDFLHCKDLPIWAQILLHPKEERGTDRVAEQDGAEVVPPAPRAA